VSEISRKNRSVHFLILFTRELGISITILRNTKVIFGDILDQRALYAFNVAIHRNCSLITGVHDS